MLQITADADRAIARTGGMEAIIATLDQQMTAELDLWQRTDMNRKWPNVAVADNTASTEIWPHSRAELGPAPARITFRRKRRPLAPMRTATRPTRRPILRPELYDKLCARMAAMLAKVSWASVTQR